MHAFIGRERSRSGAGGSLFQLSNRSICYVHDNTWLHIIISKKKIMAMLFFIFFFSTNVIGPFSREIREGVIDLIGLKIDDDHGDFDVSFCRGLSDHALVLTAGIARLSLSNHPDGLSRDNRFRFSSIEPIVRSVRRCTFFREANRA